MVENLDLRKFYDLTPGAGNPAYDPRLMFPQDPPMAEKILFLGYATGVFSSRKLQSYGSRIRTTVPREFSLHSLNLRTKTKIYGDPSGRAICEFRVRHQENIKELFPQMLKIAKRLNIRMNACAS